MTSSDDSGAGTDRVAGFVWWVIIWTIRLWILSLGVAILGLGAYAGYQYSGLTGAAGGTILTGAGLALAAYGFIMAVSRLVSGVITETIESTIAELEESS